MKKKLFFLCGFPVAGMREKKKTELQVAGWATAQFFLSLSHNTTSCIVTGKARRQHRGAQGSAGTCIWVATIRPGNVHDTTW